MVSCSFLPELCSRLLWLAKGEEKTSTCLSSRGLFLEKRAGELACFSFDLEGRGVLSSFEVCIVVLFTFELFRAILFALPLWVHEDSSSMFIWF